MTSNIGSSLILEAKMLDEKVKAEVEKELHKAFRPEFLNRVDAIVFFNKLDEKQVVKIVEIELDELGNRLLQKNIILDVGKTVAAHLAHKGYSPEFGARPLKRTVQEYVTVPISHHLLKHPATKILKITVADEKIKIK